MPETQKSFQPFLNRPSFYADESAIAKDFVDLQFDDYPQLFPNPEQLERVLLYFDSLELERSGDLIGGGDSPNLIEEALSDETDSEVKHIEINV